MGTNPLHTIGAVADLFGWIGFTIGVLCLVAWLITRAVHGTWFETDAVLVDDETDNVQGDGGASPRHSARRARWITDEGTLHERALTSEELRMLGDRESFRVFYKPRSGDHMRLEAASHSVRVLALLTAIFLGLGVLSLVIGFVVLFL